MEQIALSKITDRDERQNCQVEIFRHNPKAWLCASTGYGKTRVGLKTSKRFQDKNPDGKIYVVVPSNFIYDQWVEKLKKWDIQAEVFVVNTFVKELRECDLLIADEAHRYCNQDAEYFSKVFESKYKYCLALSATLTDEEKSFLGSKGFIELDDITLDTAIKNGWVSKLKHYNLFLDMNEFDRLKYKELNDNFQKHFGFFKHDFDDAMKCLSNKEFRKKYAKFRNEDEQFIGYHAVQFNNSMRKRKEYLYKTEAKKEAIEQLFKGLPDDKMFIGFSESTEFADDVTERIGEYNAVSYHSYLESKDVEITKTAYRKTKKAADKLAKKNKGKVTELKDRYKISWKQTKRFGAKRLKEHNLKRLKDGRYNIRFISTAKALDEGADIPNLNVGIIASGTTSQRKQVQRIGRVVRLAEEGKEAIVVNLVMNKTQDVKWLRKRNYGLKVDENFNNVNELIEHATK